MIVSYGSSKIVQASTSLANLFASKEAMIKRAAKRVEALEVDPDNFVYLRNRAVSALELHGPNQNWDAFEYDELERKYSTFIGQPISVDHIGTNVIGSVVDSEFIRTPDIREELNIPMMPLKDTTTVLGELCRKESIFKHILDYAQANKLVKTSDRKLILDAVARTIAGTSGWVENIWAINRQAAEKHTRGMIKAIMAGLISDSSMGCFPEDAKITLADFSEKNISEIRKGDKVLTHTGNVGTVTGLFKKHFSDGLYRINVTGLVDKSTPTYEHPYYVIRREQVGCSKPSVSSKGKTVCVPTADGTNYRKKSCGKVACVESYEEEKYTPEFVKAKDLSVGDYVAYSFSDEVRKTNLSKKFFRLLGYYLAEGNVALCKGRPNTTYFWLHKDEKRYIEEIRHLCEGLYGCTTKLKGHRTSANGVAVVAYSSELSADMLKYGGHLAKHKKLPEEILYAPLDHQLELIGSFINGDGFSDKYGAIYLESSSKTLIDNMMWMLSRSRILWAQQQGVYTASEKSVVKTGYKTITWKLRIPNHSLKNLANYTSKYMYYDSIKVKSYSFYYKNHLFFPVKEIEFDQDWSGYIYNFEVSGDNSYIANSVAVHNCMVGQAVCSVCGNVVTGDLPENEDFCDCIRLHKGSEMPIGGMIVIPFEINRDISFFEDSLILPFKFGGQAGGEGADKDAKLLESLASKQEPRSKRAYVGIDVAPPASVYQGPTNYALIGDMPEVVEKNREEFNEQRVDFSEESQDEGAATGEYPEGTIISIVFEGEDTDAIVVEEHEDDLIVAVDGIAEPIEISMQEVNEIIDLPEDVSYQKELDINDVPDIERHPERRAAGKRN